MHVTLLPTKKKVRQKKRVCAYARVSTDSPEQLESLQNQVAHYTEFITNHPDYEFAGVYADRDRTGTKEDRPKFREMLERCRNKEIDLIITKSISRFARNTTVMLSIVRELKALGIEVYFEKENIYTLSGDGELMLAVLSAFAEEESRSISENTKWRIRKQFEEGIFHINTKRFLGYDADEHGNLIVNEDEAGLVKRIYKDYLSGKGCHRIAKDLNTDGLVTVTGASWDEFTIRYILRNEKYKGDALLQKTFIADFRSKKLRKNTGQLDSYYVKGNHEAIIDHATWDSVQEEIKRRSEKASASAPKNNYPLSGMLFCSKCGAPLKRRTWNSGKPCSKVVWQCSTYIKRGKQACSGTRIDDSIVAKQNIKEKTIVEEVIKSGKRHYFYTSKQVQSGTQT